MAWFLFVGAMLASALGSKSNSDIGPFHVGADLEDNNGVSNLDLVEEEDADKPFDNTFVIPKVKAKK